MPGAESEDEMKAVWALARKELLLLARDRVAAGVLLLMPLVFVAVLGLILGENFGQKADETLRLSILDLDTGVSDLRDEGGRQRSWAYWVIQDLKDTPGIRLEAIPDRETAEELVRSHKRASILVLRPDFSQRVSACSFLDEPGSVNPFHREGVHLKPTKEVDLGLEVLTDPTQQAAAAINEQVVQVCMLRVLLPYMIGKAFNKLSEPSFIELLGQEVRLPVPADFPKLLRMAQKVPAFLRGKELDAMLAKLDRLMPAPELLELGQSLCLVAVSGPRIPLPSVPGRIMLAQLLALAAGGDPEKSALYRTSVGNGVKDALKKQFAKYDLTGMTWERLTRARGASGKASYSEYRDTEGSGLLRRGAARYQALVPMYTVLFSFFLVLIVGWVFVGERQQGTLKRLRLAPISRAQILLGKLLPCYFISVAQGVGLLILGKVIFDMRWGPASWSLVQQAGWLFVVVLFTSMAAMGLAMLVAALARTEAQVALYGGVPVLVLAVIGGCVLPRAMMPEQTQWLTFLTPQGWALDAYRELLGGPPEYLPNLGILARACAALMAFGAAFLAAAWALLRLD
jgi:ABC-type Na+ efflux pump permease subunit